jgi:type I restriction enzyme S subunit
VVVTDGTHDSPKLQKEGVPFVKGKHISGGTVDFENADFITREDHEEACRRVKPQRGDILFSNIGSVGDTAVVKSDVEFSIKNVALFRADVRKIDPTYLYYMVLSPKFRTNVMNVRSGSAQPFISLANLRSFEVTYHEDVTVQRRIAKILSPHDDLIENNLRRIKILEEMAGVIYREGFENGKRGRRVGHFGDLVEIVRDGVSPTDYPGEEFEHFSIPAFDVDQLPAVESAEAILSGKYMLEDRCVLLSKLNPRISRVWLAAPSGTRRALCSTEFLVLRPKTGVSREFVYMKCLSAEFRGEFTGLALGTSTSHQRVKPDDLLKMKAAVPSSQEVASFTESVGPMLRLAHNLRRKVRELRRTRDFLLPPLMSGDVDVEELDIAGIDDTMHKLAEVSK